MINILGVKFGKEEAKAKPSYGTLIKMSSAEVVLPTVSESKKYDWINFGNDNQYTEVLLKSIAASSTHNAIVQSKAKMMAGKNLYIGGKDKIESDDFYSSASEDQKRFIDKLIYSPNNEEGLQSLLFKMSLDYQVFGSFAVEVTYSADFSEIASVRHINSGWVRFQKPNEDGDVKGFYISKSWREDYIKKHEPSYIPKFSETNKTDFVQMMYFRRYTPELEYYGLPTWHPALNWIYVDGDIATFHKSNLENGFSAGMIVKNFSDNEPTPEEAQLFKRDWLRQYQGTKNTGRTIFTWSTKEEEPIVEPISVTNLDKQLIQLSESVVQNIIVAHEVTSPALVGVALPGKLGYSNELQNAQDKFDNDVIAPQRQFLEKLLEDILFVSSIDVEVVINNQSEEDVNAAEAEAKSKAELRGTVGGVQGIISINAAISEGKMNPESGVALLMNIFGFDEATARILVLKPEAPLVDPSTGNTIQ